MSDDFLDDIVGAGAPDPDRRGSRRDGRRDREVRRQRARRRSAIAVTVSLLLVAGAGYAVWTFVLPAIGAIETASPTAEDFPGPGQGTVEVTIPAGATGADMAQVLFDQGVVASTRAFSLAFSENPDAARIQPGTYRLLSAMKASDAVLALLNPDNKVQVKVTIVEGFRLTQILDRLSSVTTIPVEDFTAAMVDTAATGLPAEAGGNYEGWLFPATYTFEPGTTATEMIATMIRQTLGVLDARSVAPEDRMRVLTMASLIEREAGSAEDRPKIARSIYNRLAIDMKLDIDASVAYGEGIPGTELTRAIIDSSTSPYNLYRHTGLPPTPIASPGESSIDAVLAPADGPWLFWVTVNLQTGETLFAETYAEHQVNVAKLREWQAANPPSDG
ncbi:MAG TPA: endolytic transglycosylase MltG [Actinotalea sp.]|nr:endolytic transglycosylase MltG [Actinotalea sp.]